MCPGRLPDWPIVEPAALQAATCTSFPEYRRRLPGQLGRRLVVRLTLLVHEASKMGHEQAGLRSPKQLSRPAIPPSAPRAVEFRSLLIMGATALQQTPRLRRGELPLARQWQHGNPKSGTTGRLEFPA